MPALTNLRTSLLALVPGLAPVVATVLATGLVSGGAQGQEDPALWPRWRGPEGTGVASGPAPTRWSDEENVRWKVAIPGRGVSTPVLWGERLFLTTAVPTADGEPDPAAGGESGAGAPASTSASEQSFEVLCFDRGTGAPLWRQVACVATPHEGFHASYGSFASASPVTDGERLYVSFGSRGLYAYDLEGQLLWQASIGVELHMRNAFGEGLAPVLAGDVLVQVCDQEDASFVVAFDRATGEERWRKPRNEPSTWATPLVTEAEGRLQVITSGTERLRSYDPADGTLLWEHDGVGLNAIPAVLRCGDTLLAMSGYRDPLILALRLDQDPGSEESEAWRSTQGCAYTASPVLVDGLYYTVNDRGLISCFDALGGEAHYLAQRLPRGSTLKASPVAAGEFLYVPTEAGEVHLVRLGTELEVAATNVLAEQCFIASPAVADGALYLRSLTHLFCIGPAR